MKKVYEAPTMMTVELAEEDIVRTSDTLSYSNNGGMSDIFYFSGFQQN